MRDFIKSLGRAGWLAVLGLSAIVTVAASFGLPAFVDTKNPWVLLLAGIILFAIAYANGWKQRGLRNERDIQNADKLERDRMADEAKYSVELAKIEANKEIELERARQDRIARKEDEQRRNAEKEAEKALARKRKLIANLPTEHMAVIAEALANGGAYVSEKYDAIPHALNGNGILDDLHVVDARHMHWKLSDDAIAILECDDDLKTEIEDARIRKRELYLRNEFDHMLYVDKVFVYLLYVSSEITIDHRAYEEVSVDDFAEYTVTENDNRTYRISEEARSVLDKNPSMLSFCRPEGDLKQWLIKEFGEQVY